jgi:putative endopeptidase
MRVVVRVLSAVLAAGMVLAGCADARPHQAAKPKFGTWGVETADMDKSVQPGDDFFDYVVGSWVKTAQIPSDRTCAGNDLEIQNQLDDDLKSLVEGAAAENAPEGDISQQVGDLYSSYMDEATLNARGVEPIKPHLAAIDGVTDKANLDSTIVSLFKTSMSTPFDIGVVIDPNTPTRYVPTWSQGGLSLDGRDYYLNQDAQSTELRAKFVAHVEKLLGLAGYADARAQAEQILALETKLAEVQWPIEQTRDVSKTNTIMPRADVEKLGAGAPLQGMFDKLKLPRDTDFQVGMPDVLPKTAALFAKEPVGAWKAYMRYHLLGAYGRRLSTPFAEELFDFYGRVLSGQANRSPRWKRGVSWVSDALGDAVGQRYVALRFTEQTRNDARTLVENLRAAYSARIDAAAWMSPETKKQAQVKLAAMVAKIGYPDKWRNYESVKIRTDDLIGNVEGLEAWSWNESLSRLGKPIDRTEWAMTPQTNNAYYSARLNEIVFPAAILQPPNFDPAADPAANYGAIGATIGHEMSHGFDDQGRKSDASGALRDWWTPADAERYEREADKLVAQFGAYEPLPGTRINGELTLGENIADLAGLRIAYDAYKLSLGGQDAPVIDGLTGDQRFFLAYAANWKMICRSETERNWLLTDPHSLAKYRVNGIVRNMDEWYAAFDVTEGDELYLKPQDRVRVW